MTKEEIEEIIQQTKAEFLNENVVKESDLETLQKQSYAKGWNACNHRWIQTLNEYLSKLQVEPCEDCCNGDQEEKAKLCQKSYLAGMEHRQEPCEDAISRADAVRVASGYCHPSNIAKELAKLPPVQPKPTECEDAISRQAAISHVDDVPYIKDHPNVGLLWKAWIESLPSAQPKYNASEWCHDCKEYDQDKHRCPRFNRVIRNAVEEVKKPKTGHWIEYTRILIPEPINKWEQAWYCSECGYGNQECEDGSAWFEWKYCPNCGARMIEPQESEG